MRVTLALMAIGFSYRDALEVPLEAVPGWLEAYQSLTSPARRKKYKVRKRK